MTATQPPVEERLEQLLRVGEFAPPPEFAAHARVRDLAAYEKAATDGPAWWAERARQRLDWAAVIAVSDESTGRALIAYVTLGVDAGPRSSLSDDLRGHVGDRIGKFARPKRIIWADDLPKTRSGKIMRRLLRDIAEGREPGDATTLGDPTVLDRLQKATQESA